MIMAKGDCLKLGVGHYIAILTFVATMFGGIWGMVSYVTESINKNINLVNDGVTEIRQDVRMIDDKLDRHLEYHIENKTCEQPKEVSYALKEQKNQR